MVAPERRFKTFLSDDGSGKGAGLIAAIAERLAVADEWISGLDAIILNVVKGTTNVGSDEKVEH